MERKGYRQGFLLPILLPKIGTHFRSDTPPQQEDLLIHHESVLSHLRRISRVRDITRVHSVSVMLSLHRMIDRIKGCRPGGCEILGLKRSVSMVSTSPVGRGQSVANSQSRIIESCRPG